MRRVLVVDDEENIRLVLRTLLKRHGYEVEAAPGGEEALGLVESFGPDVVITDVRMPPSGDDEGIRVARRLRATHPDVGVVVLSQYAEPRYGLGLLEDGAEGRAYLLK